MENCWRWPGCCSRPAQAEAIKVGILKVGASGPVYIAQERGYFATEGLTAEPVTFGAGQAVAVAVVSRVTNVTGSAVSPSAAK